MTTDAMDTVTAGPSSPVCTPPSPAPQAVPAEMAMPPVAPPPPMPVARPPPAYVCSLPMQQPPPGLMRREQAHPAQQQGPLFTPMGMPPQMMYPAMPAPPPQQPSTSDMYLTMQHMSQIILEQKQALAQLDPRYR